MTAFNTEPKQARDSLTEEQRFERVVATVSRLFLGLPSEKVEEGFQEALELIIRTLNVDRCVILKFDESEGIVLTLDGAALNPGMRMPHGTEAEITWSQARMREGKAFWYSTLDELPEEAAADKAHFSEFRADSLLAIPLRVGGDLVGSLAFDTVGRTRTWCDEDIKRFTLIAECFSNALERKRAYDELRSAFLVIHALKARLQTENIYLREGEQARFSKDGFVGESQAWKAVLTQAEQVGATSSTVLLLGETGTGKEVVADLIHQLSQRRERVLVKVNCGCLPATLVESELFGREKGAYTGAATRQVGRFEFADGSTIFLDEVGDLSLDMQVKLLRVLERGEFERLGSSQTIKVDVRVIAATNRNLEQAIKRGEFRMDLYYHCAAPAGATGRHPAADVEVRQRVHRPTGQADRVHSPPHDENAQGLLLAGQCARASQHHRARRDPRGWPHPSHQPARGPHGLRGRGDHPGGG